MKIKSILILCFYFSLFITAQAQKNNDDNRIIRVLSFNIYHGETMNHNFDLDVIAKVINESKADFVAMQEVDYKTNRAKKLDLTTELAIRTNMIPLFARAMYYDEGEYGEGILSKYSFLETTNIALPYTHGNEPRAALKIKTVLSSGDTICIIGTHLDHLKNDTDRVKQAKALNEIKITYPTILMGDLNDIPNSKTINILEQNWHSAYNKENPKATYPSNHPELKIDYVMFQPKEKWQVIKTEVINDSIASDHCAYLVTLKLLK